jgi:hypothetical protein
MNSILELLLKENKHRYLPYKSERVRWLQQWPESHQQFMKLLLTLINRLFMVESWWILLYLQCNFSFICWKNKTQYSGLIHTKQVLSGIPGTSACKPPKAISLVDQSSYSSLKFVVNGRLNSQHVPQHNYFNEEDTH